MEIKLAYISVRLFTCSFLVDDAEVFLYFSHANFQYFNDSEVGEILQTSFLKVKQFIKKLTHFIHLKLFFICMEDIFLLSSRLEVLCQSLQQPHVMSQANDSRWVINRRADELLKIFSHAKVRSVKEYKQDVQVKRLLNRVFTYFIARTSH